MAKEKSVLQCLQAQRAWKCLLSFVEEGDVVLPRNMLQQLQVVGRRVFCARFELLVPLHVGHCPLPEVGPPVPAAAPCPFEANPADLAQMKVKLNEACSELQSTWTVRSGQAAEGLILYSTYIQKRLNSVYTQAQLCWHKTASTATVYFAWQQVWAASRVVLAVQSTKLQGVNTRGTPWAAEEPIPASIPPAPEPRAAREGQRSIPGAAQPFNLFIRIAGFTLGLHFHLKI